MVHDPKQLLSLVILSLPQLQASVDPFSSASQNGVNFFLAVFILLLLLTTFSLFPSSLAQGVWASQLLDLLAPVATWLLGIQFQIVWGFSVLYLLLAL